MIRITNLTLGGVTLAGTNRVTGTLNWTGGSVGPGPLTIAAGGVVNVLGDAVKYLLGPLTNAGTVNFTNAGPLNVYNNGGPPYIGHLMLLPSPYSCRRAG